MKRIALPLSLISVVDRQRIELGDIDGLMDSISRFGLIQPIVVNQDNRLIAGGRRLEACRRLNMPAIDVVYRETMSEDELHELELEENVRRKDMTWQERCLCVEQIHRLKQRNGALSGTSWGQRETGEMLGIALGAVNYSLTIAAELRKDEKSPLWQCENLSDAWKVLLRRKEEAVLAEQARRSAANPFVPVAKAFQTNVVTVRADEDELKAARERYYSNPLNPPDSFDAYWAEKNAREQKNDNLVYISNRLILGDSIAFMSHPDNEGRFDHVITDPPYGIDMENLEQDNLGMVDIDLVAEEHDVADNTTLLRSFFPAAFRCLKPNAFCVTFCDITLWQTMYDAAVAAGFKVQRWPLVWIKPIAMNSCAQYNFTKTIELAMVCRKGNAVLMKSQSSCVLSASHDWMRKAFGHPFVKPAALWNWIIEAISLPGQTILDPFAGRGSGVVSTLAAGRAAFGVEVNIGHYNALMENVKQHYLKQNKNTTFK